MRTPIEHVLGEFRLSPEEYERTAEQARCEFERLSPTFMKIATMLALLPIVRQRTEEHFRWQGKPTSELEDLGETVLLKICKAIFGAWPKGNYGAWVAKIRENVGNDFGRQVNREAKLGRRRNADLLSQLPAQKIQEEEDREAREQALWLFISGLPEETREIIRRLRAKESWKRIANDLGTTVKDARQEIQGIEWPGGSSPLPDRRRRK